MENLLPENPDTTAFFGFADQNLTTSPYIYKNVIPAQNKNGVEKIGFTIKKEDRWKYFCTINKPEFSEWEDETEKISRIYSRNNKEVYDQVSEIMWKSYEGAENFADLNAFIFSGICAGILGIKLHFFRYSDISKEQIFTEETKKLLMKVKSYNKAYNQTIEKENLNLRPVRPEEIPLWYQCRCGGKVSLERTSGETVSGICPVCKKRHELLLEQDFKGIRHYFKDLSFSAVARNMIFSEGLRVTAFISGPGGGLEYGRVSDQISAYLGFHTPATFAWRSKDYYLGNIHKNALRQLYRTYNINKNVLVSRNFPLLVLSVQDEMIKEIRNSESLTAGKNENRNDSKELQAKKGRLLNLKKNGIITSKIFSSTPSALDLFMNFKPDYISRKWKDAINSSSVEQMYRAYIFKNDITYEENMENEEDLNKIPLLYHNVINFPVN
ncbi:hypothetical protein [Methanoplanus limicola]|nr:hypothetical protein [Methanoplanus limicola]